MKKLIATVLALALALVPVLSMAAGVDDVFDAMKAIGMCVTTTTTVSSVNLNGVDAESAGMVNDVLGILSVTAYDQGTQEGFSVNLSGQPVLSFTAKENGEDSAYLASNLLGDHVILISQDEMQALVTKGFVYYVDTQVAAGQMSASQGEYAKQEFAAQMQQAMQAQGAGFNMEDLMALNLTDADFAGTLQAVMEITQNAQVDADVSALPANVDPADQRIVLTMDGNQIINVLTALLNDVKANQGLMDLLTRLAASSGNQVPDMSAALEQAVADMASSDPAENAKVTETLTVYVDAESMPVYAELLFKVEDDTLALTYARQTAADGVHHTVNMNVQDVNMCFAVVDGGEEHVMVSFSIAQDGVEMLHVNLVADTIVGVTSDRSTLDIDLSVNTGSTYRPEMTAMHLSSVKNGRWTATDASANTVTTFSVNGVNMVTLNSETTIAQPAEALNTAAAVSFVNMSDAEFSAFVEEISTTALMQLMMAILQLPQSVRGPLMGN